MISWFARNHVAANLLMLAVVAAGAWTLFSGKIPLEVFPDVPSRMLSVSVPYPGSTPEEVEEMIVLKIEEAIQQVQGIKHINSTASSSGANISIEVEEGSDPRQVLEDVKIRVDAVPQFPEEAEKPVVQLDDWFMSVITVVISAEMADRDLRRLGEQVRDEVGALPGISHVSLGGIRPLEISMEIPEATLRKYGLTLESISRAIQGAAIDLPAGVVQTESGDVAIRTRGRAYSGDDYAKVVVLTREDGTKLTLGDIAMIEDGFNENPLIARLNGRKCVVVNVMREGSQNAIKIADDVKAYIEAARSKLPDGVTIEYWNDRSKIVKGRIDLLLGNAQSSLILVFLCIGLFLRLDSVIWVALGLPVAFLGAFALMPWLGITINTATLFGFILVLGIVVDDAIVISEHVDKLQRQGLPPLQAAIEGTRRMAVPITFGVLTTVMAFLPMVFEKGDWARMFQPIALVFVTVMLIALVETKIILPAHLAHPFMEPVMKHLAPFYNFTDGCLQWVITHLYRPSIRWSLEHRYTVLAIFFGGLLLLCGFFFGGRILFVKFPRIDSERIEARLTMLDGTPFEVTDRHIARIYEIGEELRREYVGPDGKPVIRHILATTGTTRLTSSTGGSGGVSHLGEVNMECYGPEERSLKIRTPEIANEWRRRIGQIVGAEELNFRAEILRSGDPIDVQLSGTNPQELLALSSQIKDKLGQYRGVFDIADSLDSGRNEIQLRLKPEARQFGVTVNDLARQVRQAFYGYEVQRIQRGRNEVKVMVRSPRNERRNLATLDTMRVRLADGLELPFSSVAEIKVDKSFTSIRRVDRRRALNVTADVDKSSTDVAVVRAGLSEYLTELMAAHPHVHWSFEGEARSERESASAGWMALITVGLGLYAMMAIPFKSYTQPLIVLLVIPFGVVGAVLGHLFHGMPVSMMSLFGMLAVSGVIVNDTLVLVDEINSQRDETGDLKLAAREGGASRFRAILLTQITTFFGLVPLIFDNSPQSTHNQFLLPVSVAMGYGSLFATVITLYLVPLCYLAVDDLLGLFRKQRRQAAPVNAPADDSGAVVGA